MQVDACPEHTIAIPMAQIFYDKFSETFGNEYRIPICSIIIDATTILNGLSVKTGTDSPIIFISKTNSKPCRLETLPKWYWTTSFTVDEIKVSIKQIVKHVYACINQKCRYWKK